MMIIKASVGFSRQIFWLKLRNQFCVGGSWKITVLSRALLLFSFLYLSNSIRCQMVSNKCSGRIAGSSGVCQNNYLILKIPFWQMEISPKIFQQCFIFLYQKKKISLRKKKVFWGKNSVSPVKNRNK